MAAENFPHTGNRRQTTGGGSPTGDEPALGHGVCGTSVAAEIIDRQE